MFYSKQLKKFKNINHFFFLEKEVFQKASTKVLIVVEVQKITQKKMLVEISMLF